MNLDRLRTLVKRLKTRQDPACELRATDDTAARLLAVLVCRPEAFEPGELVALLHGSRARKVHDWLVNSEVRKSPRAEELRVAWLADADLAVASAGWALTPERVAKKLEGLDLPGLLDTVESR
ncbi:hypothetical protein [Arthrobacter mobilis]|uniref:hypothetical protein n=1 Tax=Arthrobacter mobilis TaxID=2724944 RepID=UPI0028AEFE89|nr:hypothetical protein [Arthrobacter mobilis]